MSIFESLVSDSWSQLFRQDAETEADLKCDKSAKIELCVICRFSLEKKITDRTNPGCSEEDPGNESQIDPASRRDFQTFPATAGICF
jgi:hypothetical protein